MIKLGFSPYASDKLTKEHLLINERVADSASTLLRGLGFIENLVKPKHLVFHDAYLYDFDRKVSDGRNHSIRVNTDKAVEEKTEWQIFGEVQGRIVNVIFTGIFYTSENNRSGHREYFINGKPLYGTEKITLDEIWQDTMGYRRYLDSSLTKSVMKGTEILNKS